MKNKFFRFLILALSLVTLAGVLNSFACGDNFEGVENVPPQILSYTLNSDGLGYTVSGVKLSSETALEIPSVYNGLPVTAIGNRAFEGCEYLTQIKMPDSVVSIGFGAFEDCLGLTSVTIGKGVKSIGSGAFFYCSNLTSVYIPKSVTDIEIYAFYDCESLTDIYCEVENQPSGWIFGWYNGNPQIHWGYTANSK